MKRAAILIGVDKSGDLPKLRDAARGARLMEAWALAQDMDPVHVITDEQKPVTIERIKKVVRDLVDAANVSQLLIYFAGHGVNLQRQEYWLLTDAPDDPQAAVNVATSVALASTCGIPHIVLMSDACRTAAEGIRAQSVRGSEIFPNREGETTPVDQFFACQLGRPSHEVKDPAVTSAEFKALYTNELVPALMGQRAQIVEWVGDAARVGHVHPRPLRDFMSAAVASRLTGYNLQTRLIQVPVAQISSDPPAWIAQVSADATPDRVAAGTPPGTRGLEATPESMTTDLLRGPPLGRGAVVDFIRPGFEAIGGAGLVVDAMRLAQPFGPTHHETACGFKLRGAKAVEAVANRARVELVSADDLRVYPERPGANVLLVLEGGAGVLLPAIPEFLCALSFDDGELLDVAYEPSDNTGRWGYYRQRAEEIRSLRAIASSAMARGSFKLDNDDALFIAQRMQLAKGVDPSLALYAAYAYHDLQRPGLIRQMADYLREDLSAVLFDVALLARLLNKQRLDGEPLLGPVPLLAQGWSLLRAFGVELPAGLAALGNLRLPSLWTMFEPRGVDVIRGAFSKGDL